MAHEVSNPSIYLSDVSERDKPWDIHRAASDQVRDLYRQGRHLDYGSRINDCSPVLGFALREGNEGELALKLKTAFFCRVRHCPTCQWRRSMKWRAKLIQALPKIYEDHPTIRWIFVTLTVKNCEIAELRSTLLTMSKSWEKFSKRKAFPGLGWIRTVEVTRSENGAAHPHYHCLIAVPSSYFGKNYLKQADWTRLWKESLKVDYTPIVDVRSVNPRSKNKGDAAKREIFEAICETFKYSIKESDLTSDFAWLEELTDQLHKTRAVATGGILKPYLQDYEWDADSFLDGEGDFDKIFGHLDDEPTMSFGWREKVKRYSAQ